MSFDYEARHFRDVAKILNDLPVEASRGIREYSSPMPHPTYHAISLVESFCDLFAEHHPDFDKARFIEACGYEPWDQVIMGVPFNEAGESTL